MKMAYTDSIAAAKTLLAMLQADFEIQKKLNEVDNLSMRIVEDLARVLHAREQLNASTESAIKDLCRKWDEMVELQNAVFTVHPPIGELYAVRK